MPEVTLRQATTSDAEFAFDIEEDAMRAYAEQTWGVWNPAADRQGHIKAFAPAVHSIIEVEGRPAGLVAVEQHPDHVFLGKRYLSSRYRNAGVGAQVFEMVLADARVAGKSAKLHVLTVNHRAQAFYARHGFTIEEVGPERVFMSRSARSHDGR